MNDAMSHRGKRRAPALAVKLLDEQTRGRLVVANLGRHLLTIFGTAAFRHDQPAARLTDPLDPAPHDPLGNVVAPEFEAPELQTRRTAVDREDPDWPWLLASWSRTLGAVSLDHLRRMPWILGAPSPFGKGPLLPAGNFQASKLLRTLRRGTFSPSGIDQEGNEIVEVLLGDPRGEVRRHQRQWAEDPLRDLGAWHACLSGPGRRRAPGLRRPSRSRSPSATRPSVQTNVPIRPVGRIDVVVGVEHVLDHTFEASLTDAIQCRSDARPATPQRVAGNAVLGEDPRPVGHVRAGPGKGFATVIQKLFHPENRRERLLSGAPRSVRVRRGSPSGPNGSAHRDPARFGATPDPTPRRSGAPRRPGRRRARPHARSPSARARPGRGQGSDQSRPHASGGRSIGPSCSAAAIRTSKAVDAFSRIWMKRFGGPRRVDCHQGAAIAHTAVGTRRTIRFFAFSQSPKRGSSRECGGQVDRLETRIRHAPRPWLVNPRSDLQGPALDFVRKSEPGDPGRLRTIASITSLWISGL